MTTLRPYPTYKPSGVDWLGDVPSHWSVGPLKSFVKTNRNVLPESTNLGYQFRYVDIGSVSTGSISRDLESFTFGSAPSRARRIVSKGDTVVSTVRTYLKAVYTFRDETENTIASTGFAVISPGSSTESAFLGFALQENGFVDTVVGHSTGVAYPAITEPVLGKIPVAFPPLDEQREIAGFLDVMDARITRFVAARKRMIALLEEQKAAIITQAVTRGLDPDVPLKPSGVDWLGDIPAHWDVRKVGGLSTLIQTGPFGSQLSASHYVQQGVPLINPSHIVEGLLQPDPSVAVSEYTANRLSRHRLSVGDIVLARRGEMGRCAVIDRMQQGWLCGTGSILIRPDRRRIEPLYLQLILSNRWLAAWLVLASAGATMSNLNTTMVSGVQICLPSIEEQQAISCYVEEQEARFRRIILRANQEINLIREYRTRLISDVVTGKLNVRGVEIPAIEEIIDAGVEAEVADVPEDESIYLDRER